MCYYNQHQKHKVFTSFYHHDDQKYKDYIDYWFGDKIINKSVMENEYNPDNRDEYIKRLIREDKVSDSSVIIVLVGPNTRRRKHVDWEIYAGLRSSVNGSSGLVGVLLPELPLTQSCMYHNEDLPPRLLDNVESGYAALYTWDFFISNFESIIETAFNNRIKNAKYINNKRPQMNRNLGRNE